LYKLAIFDFDGTLVDSASGIVEVMRQIVREYKLPKPILEEWRQLVGIPLERQMELIFPDKGASFRDEIANRYRTVYDSEAIERCPPFPGLGETLECLKRSGVRLSIVSSKRRHLVEQVVDHHCLASYFSLIIGAQEVTYHKPHPEAVHITVNHLSIGLADTIVIGDSIYDLDMARNAGVAAIGVTTGIHSQDILKTSEPKCIVNQLEDVLPVILDGQMNVA